MLNRLLLVCVLVGIATPSFAFPTNGVLDAFTACSDNATPPNASWTNAIFFGAASQQVDCEDAAATTRLSSNEGDAYYNVASYNAAVEAYASFAVVGGNDNAYVCIRMQDIGSNTTEGYCLWFDDGTNHLDIYRINNGAATLVGTGVSQEASDGDSWGITGIGAQLCSYYKASGGSWVQKECAVDGSPILTGGRIGIVVNGDQAVGLLDNFGGGNLPTGARRMPVILD